MDKIRGAPYQLSMVLYLHEELPENDEERVRARVSEALEDAGFTFDVRTIRLMEVAQRGSVT